MSLPLFSWLSKRSVGVLLHPTSLPSPTGIGNLGKDAERFLKFMNACGLTCWQMCPIGPTGYGDSPYQCFSAFAGSPYLIDLVELVKFKLLDESDLVSLRQLPNEKVDFGALFQNIWPILKKAYRTYSKQRSKELDDLFGKFDDFKERHAYWLESYCAFNALKSHFQGAPWWEWPSEYRSYVKATKCTIMEHLEVQETMEAMAFFQYLFYGQFIRLKNLANAMNIQLIGDIPIFVAMDSADIWANPEYYILDHKTGLPSEVAGVPPDYFSADGQLWGNPLYDWKELAETGYKWWIERFRTNFELFDILRIDHFRGFEAYWSVKYGSKTAREGEWKAGPGFPFFRAIHHALPNAKLIAEDLGYITDGVRKLLADTGLPGMAVLQFAFGSGNKNAFLPHNLIKNQVVYPGTHDNDTAQGWYQTTNEITRDYFRRYCMVDGSNVSWDLIRAVYRSTCNLAIIPLQDFMSLNNDARMNYPGTTFNNWQWRFLLPQLENLEHQNSHYLQSLKETYDR